MYFAPPKNTMTTICNGQIKRNGEIINIAIKYGSVVEAVFTGDKEGHVYKYMYVGCKLAKISVVCDNNNDNTSSTTVVYFI